MHLVRPSCMPGIILSSDWHNLTEVCPLMGIQSSNTGLCTYLSCDLHNVVNIAWEYRWDLVELHHRFVYWASAKYNSSLHSHLLPSFLYHATWSFGLISRFPTLAPSYHMQCFFKPFRGRKLHQKNFPSKQVISPPKSNF